MAPVEHLRFPRGIRQDYLTTGSSDAAVVQYREILKLQPGDALSAQLLRRLSGQSPSEPAPPPTEIAATPAGHLEGAWGAEPTCEGSIARC